MFFPGALPNGSLVQEEPGDHEEAEGTHVKTRPFSCRPVDYFLSLDGCKEANSSLLLAGFFGAVHF